MNDLKFASRQLLKNPGFTLVAVLTLAIAIGASTAIYSAVQTTIVDPLPVKDADRLMSIESFNTREGRQPEHDRRVAAACGIVCQCRGL